MSSLKVILESHPIKNLNAVIKSVKSEIAPKLALSKDKKRHSKAKLIQHILVLDKMGLLKERPGMYVKPSRAKKEKSNIIVDVEKVKKSGMIKVDVKKAKAAGVKIINEKPKAKAKAKAKPKSKAKPKDDDLPLGVPATVVKGTSKSFKPANDDVKKANEIAAKQQAKAKVEDDKRKLEVSKLIEMAIKLLKGKPKQKEVLDLIKQSNNPGFIKAQLASISKEPKKAKTPVDVVVDLKQAMNPIFDKKFNPKSVVDRINSKKDIDDINKEITIIQKKVKEVSGKLKSSGKETEAEKKQLQKLQEKYTKRLKSIVNSMKKGASFL